MKKRVSSVIHNGVDYQFRLYHTDIEIEEENQKSFTVENISAELQHVFKKLNYES